MPVPSARRHLRSLGFGASLRILTTPATPTTMQTNLRSLGFGASLRTAIPAGTDGVRTDLRSLGFGASLRIREGRRRQPGVGISEVSASELH